MPHEDGPVFEPLVVTLSLGSYTLLDLYPREDTQRAHPAFSLLLEPGSLLILSETVYLEYLHGIAPSTQDIVPTSQIINLLTEEDHLVRTRTQTRISLTFRCHKNVVNLNKILGIK